MQISNGKVVFLTYQLTITDQYGEKETIETVEKDEPMVFLMGMSGLPEAFESNIQGLEVNDTFDFEISPDNGYGEYDPTAVVELPKEIFTIDGEVLVEALEVGNFIPMNDDQGNRLQGKVVELKENCVVMDFNHPLVGKAMHFVGEILNVREATPDEIAHGHVHGDGGVHH